MPSSNELRVELLRGPLGPGLIREIARLYGSYNPKYLDPEFCRVLFNENPRKFSLHAVARSDRNSVAGHYAVLPLDLVLQGVRIPAGKGEAFVVDEEFRAASAATPGGEPMPVGLALARSLYQYSGDQGLPCIHMIASREVGLIHRMAGCRGLEARKRRLTLALDPQSAVQDATSAGRRSTLVMLARAQRAAFRLSASLLAARSGIVSRVLDPEADQVVFARAAVDAHRASGWTLAVDAPFLRWMALTGKLELVSLGEGMQDYALVHAGAGVGDAMELLVWRQSTTGLHAALGLLRATVERAIHGGLRRVILSEAAAGSRRELDSMRTAARMLCFRDRIHTTNLYLFRPERELLEPGSLNLVPFFHAMF